MSVASLKAVQNEMKGKQRKYRERLREVEKIRTALASVASSDASDINRMLSMSSDYLSESIAPYRYISQASDVLQTKRDKSREDPSVSDAYTMLGNEIKRINRELEALGRQISQYDSKIEDAKAAEKNKG